MELSMQAERMGERLMVAAIAVYGDNAILALSNLVAALAEGTEVDHHQGLQEVRRLYFAGNNAVEDAVAGVSHN